VVVAALLVVGVFLVVWHSDVQRHAQAA